MGVYYKKFIEIYKKTNGKCIYCGCDEAFAIEHFVPKNKNGTNKIENLFPICRGCNIQKGPRSLEHFRKLRINKIHNIPNFSDEQINYLKKKGFNLPKFHYEFYFEKEKIEVPLEAMKQAFKVD